LHILHYFWNFKDAEVMRIRKNPKKFSGYAPGSATREIKRTCTPLDYPYDLFKNLQFSIFFNSHLFNAQKTDVMTAHVFMQTKDVMARQTAAMARMKTDVVSIFKLGYLDTIKERLKYILTKNVKFWDILSQNIFEF